MMRISPIFLACSMMLLSADVFSASHDETPYRGWLNWRGPTQNGFYPASDLPDEVEPGGENHLWSYEISGRGTPVIANGRLFGLGYRGEGPDLQEFVFCLDAETGELIWEHGFSDFISDIIYNRYSIGSPAIDAETGNVYIMTSPGIFACFSFDGKLLWQRSMMEEFGRLTFPNGRTGSPLIDEDLVIVRGITSNWGANGPARDRFYAFDKKTSELVWTCTPGVAPKDSSFSTPVLGWHNGMRVFYAGTGCGNVVCVNARTGQALWRYQFSYGGVNSTPLLWNDRLIVIHGKENLDTTEIGRMVALNLNMEIEPGEPQQVLDNEYEVWRNPLGIFTSSPTLGSGMVFQTVLTGELNAVDPNTGQIFWTEKLGPSQLHASPLFADGKVYVPLENGEFFIISPNRRRARILSETKLEGFALGQPAAWNGKIYVHTTSQLYCFGKKGDPNYKPSIEKSIARNAGSAVQLQVVPSEVLLRPGEEIKFKLRSLDRLGFSTGDVSGATWEKHVPATARVRSYIDAEFGGNDTLVAKSSATLSAGALRAEKDDLSGLARGRILPDLPIKEDFTSFELTQPRTDGGGNFAYPPLPWIGARFKWEIHDLDGNKVLAKTLDRVLFQRAMTFIGHPDMKNYTVEADIMTDGNRRMMSNGGVINQRYIIQLVGNAKQLEVVSNHERVKVSVPFPWKPKVWYRLKTRVDVAADGSGVIRAKAWERGTPEPEAWTIEVPHKNAHQQGAPGLWGFSPQSRFRVYLDNVSVYQN